MSMRSVNALRPARDPRARIILQAFIGGWGAGGHVKKPTWHRWRSPDPVEQV